MSRHNKNSEKQFWVIPSGLKELHLAIILRLSCILNASGRIVAAKALS